MANKQQSSGPQSGGKHGNDPAKNDPTRQDERDNDATRIRPEKENKEKPATPPDPSGSTGVEEPDEQAPYKRTPGGKKRGIEEPDTDPKKQYNPAAPADKRKDTTEKSDSGDPVLKKYGKGL